jgi:hypothetical protein
VAEVPLVPGDDGRLDLDDVDGCDLVVHHRPGEREADAEAADEQARG